MSAATVAVSLAAPRDRLGRQCARRRAAGRAARPRRLRRPGRRARRAGRRTPVFAGSSAARDWPSTGSSARAPVARSARRAAIRSAAGRCGRDTVAGTSPRCSSRSRPTASRWAASTAASALAPRVAVRRAQAFYGLGADGIAGPATLAALSRAPVRAPALRSPIAAPLGDRYGPRGTTFHAGLDFPAVTGTPVTAAGAGRVVFAGYNDGWGTRSSLDHGNARAHPLRPPVRDHGLARRLGARPAPRSAASAPPATPPAHTCTSRSRSAAPTPTRASRSGSTDAPAGHTPDIFSPRRPRSRHRAASAAGGCP